MIPKMKINPDTEAVAKVFNTLSPEDIERVNLILSDLGIFATVWDPIIHVHCQLAIAAVIEEIRTIELGKKVLSQNERETLKALLKL